MPQILLVEDSNMFGRLAKKRIEQEFNVPVYWTKDLAETAELLKQAEEGFSMAVLDYNLPDAPSGEIIDLVTGAGISSFVFTSDMTEEVRSYVWSKRVADYILKEDPNSLEYLVDSMRQLGENQNSLILVVDGDRVSRSMLSELLYVRQYRVINASEGQAALDILDQYPGIGLVILDYNMPGPDGCRLCQKIREKNKPDRLAIIGMHSDNDRGVAARFIKSGANDFIVKTDLLVEEFYCRVNRCLETVDLFARIREGAIRDFLTGLHNRRYFFDVGVPLVLEKYEAGDQLSCVMIDVDHFKLINDNHGHDIGDFVLKHVADCLQEQTEDNEIVARLGGEEFSLLVPDLGRSEVVERMERLRLMFERQPVVLPEGASVPVTVSIGACLRGLADLDEMLKIADQNLYLAKERGRNRICF